MNLKTFDFNKIKYLIVELFIVVVILLNSGHLYQIIEKSNTSVIMFFGVTIILILVFLFKKKRIKIDIKTETLVIFLFSIIFSFALNLEVQQFKLYLSYIAMLLFAYIFTDFVSFETFIKKYQFYLCIIAVISLLGTFLVNHNLINIKLPLIISTNNRMYFDGKIYFYPQYYETLRNQGVFWEPGLFASFLIVGLVFEVLKKEKKNKFYIVIFLVTLITTMSTAGILLLIITLFLYLTNLVYGKEKPIIGMILLIMLSIIVLFWDNIFEHLVKISPHIFSKINRDHGSFSTRVQSILINLEIFSSSPIFGKGLGGATREYIQLSSNVMIDAQSSTNSYFLASLGILGIVYTIAWAYGVFSSKKTTKTAKVLLFIIILIILNKEPHQSLLFTWVLLFYLISSKRKTILNGEENVIQET